MNSLDAYHHLRDLDELSICNLRGSPPRITRDTMKVAAKRAFCHSRFEIDTLGTPGQMSTESDRIFADQLNDMLAAAWALSDVSGEEIVKANNGRSKAKEALK